MRRGALRIIKARPVYRAYATFNTPKDLKYTKTHEWVRMDGNGVATQGISDYAQQELKAVVYVDLPSIGQTVQKGQTLASLDSQKATAECYAGVSGEVVEINESLNEKPNNVNSDPYGQGWIAKIKVKDQESDLKSLLDAPNYEKFLKEHQDHH